MRQYLKAGLYTLSVGSILLTGCGGGETKSGDKDPSRTVNSDKLVAAASSQQSLEIEGEIFSIPSPIQTAFLIQGAGVGFNEGAINSLDVNYVTKFKQALNLGVYGADLGYMSIYDQPKLALDYLKKVETLADEIGIASAFDESLIDRFAENSNNKDSLLVMVGEAFASGDAYLKREGEKDIAGLILAGGWVEGLHFAVDALKEKNDPKIAERIAQQKQALESLVNLLTKFKTTSEDFDQLIVAFSGLRKEFETIEILYEFRDPETDPSKKKTVLKNVTSYQISDEKLKEISKQLEAIRELITT